MKEIKLTDEEIKELLNGLGWSHDQGQEIDESVAIELAIKLNKLMESDDS